MKQKTFLCSLMSLFFSLYLSAGDIKLFSRKDWGAAQAKQDNLTSQKYINKIIIGHTVTDLDEPALTLQAIQKNQMNNNNFSDIGYTMCINKNGDIYNCRDKKYVPVILKKHNNNTCAVGILGRCDKHKDALKFDKTRIKNFAYALAQIAGELNFDKLEHKKNIFGMSDLDPKRFPISPGKNFMNNLDEIIKQANRIINN